MEHDTDKSILRRVERYCPSKSFLYECFDKIPKDKLIDKFTSPGTRVLVAKYPDYYKLFFLKYHEAGERYYPNGGIEVWNANEECKTAFFVDSVALHPLPYLAKVREIHDKNGNVTDYAIAEKVPITKSDERNIRKLERREKLMEKASKREAKEAEKAEKMRVKLERKHKKLVKQQKIQAKLNRKAEIKKQIEAKLKLFTDAPKKKDVKVKETKINKKVKHGKRKK